MQLTHGAGPRRYGALHRREIDFEHLATAMTATRPAAVMSIFLSAVLVRRTKPHVREIRRHDRRQRQYQPRGVVMPHGSFAGAG